MDGFVQRNICEESGDIIGDKKNISVEFEVFDIFGKIETSEIVYSLVDNCFTFSSSHLREHGCTFQLLRGSAASRVLFCAFWEGDISGPGEIPSYKQSLPSLLAEI